MPLRVPVYNGGPNNRQALVSFVLSVRDFLEELVADNLDPKGEPLFIGRLWELMKPAWEEGKPVFARLANNLGETQSSILIEHGLGGQQLRFKLGVVRYFNEQYVRFGKGVLKRLLEAIDTLLKSIIKAAGLGDAAEELKDYIEKCIDD